MDKGTQQQIYQIGKIYGALTDKSALCNFYLESLSAQVDAQEAYLYLQSSEKKLWLESEWGDFTAKEGVKERVSGFLKVGHLSEGGESEIFIPLVYQNAVLGAACFVRSNNKEPFSKEDVLIADQLTNQMAGALKNILVYQKNVEIERLAAVGHSMGMVMHEVKNIAQLASFARTWLELGIKNNKKDHIERGLRGVAKSIKELNEFSHEILSLTNDYALTLVPISLQAIFAELQEDLQEKAEALGVQLQFKIKGDLDMVPGDERSLYRALLNLIKNALEACEGRQGEVRVEATVKDKSHYEILVADDGEGMCEEAQARLFEAFYTTKGLRGTGLGLMIVKRTIEKHLGKIEFESALGKGTVFQLLMPLS